MSERSSPEGPTRTARGFHRDLNTLDFTLLVVGAVIGADVYIVSGMGASLLGPAQLVAWLAAGVLAALIALAFVQCSILCPQVGGSYAYTREAFGTTAGFVAGWALYAGEWIALPVFPLTFARYFGYFVQLSRAGTVAVMAALVLLVTLTNLIGVRSGGRTNDVLTAAKLLPLAILVVVGFVFFGRHTAVAMANLQPFAPLGWGHFGAAVLLIFWAYAGFELAVLPADEVREPRRTMPIGLITGMAIATAFYLLTATAVVIALPWWMASASPRPLTDALGSMLLRLGPSGTAGAVLMSLGGMISVAGVYEAFSLGLARLSYAMAADGLLPAPLARLHPRFGTPAIGLGFQAACAFVVALLINVQSLIAISVFFLGIVYVATALSAVRLVRRSPQYRLRLPGLSALLVLAALSGAYLSLQASPRLIVAGCATMLFGIGLYLLRGAAWRAAAAARSTTAAEAHRLRALAQRREAWLLHALRRDGPPNKPLS